MECHPIFSILKIALVQDRLESRIVLKSASRITTSKYQVQNIPSPAV